MGSRALAIALMVGLGQAPVQVLSSRSPGCDAQAALLEALGNRQISAEQAGDDRGGLRVALARVAGRWALTVTDSARKQRASRFFAGSESCAHAAEAAAIIVERTLVGLQWQEPPAPVVVAPPPTRPREQRLARPATSRFAADPVAPAQAPTLAASTLSPAQVPPVSETPELAALVPPPAQIVELAPAQISVAPAPTVPSLSPVRDTSWLSQWAASTGAMAGLGLPGHGSIGATVEASVRIHRIVRASIGLMGDWPASEAISATASAHGELSLETMSALGTASFCGAIGPTTGCAGVAAGALTVIGWLGQTVGIHQLQTAQITLPAAGGVARWELPLTRSLVASAQLLVLAPLTQGTFNVAGATGSSYVSPSIQASASLQVGWIFL